MADQKKCFVVSPIGDEGSDIRKQADMVFKIIIEPALEEIGFEVRRADRNPQPKMINDVVVEAIANDELVVADLSRHNPNVFYELGIRHAIAKPCVHLFDGNGRMPFDIGGHAAIPYKLDDIHNMIAARDALRDQAQLCMDGDFRVSNPVTQAQVQIALHESSDPRGQAISDIVDRLDFLLDFHGKTTEIQMEILDRIDRSGHLRNGLVSFMQGQSDFDRVPNALRSKSGVKPTGKQIREFAQNYDLDVTAVMPGSTDSDPDEKNGGD